MDIREIAVDTDNLHSDVDELEDGLRSLQEKTKGMSEKVAELNAMWEGAAHDTFSGEFQKDCGNMQELLKEVEKLIGHMRYAERQYISCEDAISSIISKIRI